MHRGKGKYIFGVVPSMAGETVMPGNGGDVQTIVSNGFAALVADAAPVDSTVYIVVVAIACFVLGAVFGAWGVARATSAFALQGLLVGLAAMALYFGLCSAAPDGLAGVIAGYGLGVFVMFNALRTIGCVAGAVYRRRFV